jgi:signal transduction histidine kinase
VTARWRPAVADLVAAGVLVAFLAVPLAGSTAPWAGFAALLGQVAALLGVRSSPVAAALLAAATTPVLVLVDAGPYGLVWPLLALLVGLHGRGDLALVASFAAAVGSAVWWGPGRFVVAFVVSTAAGALLLWGTGRAVRVVRDRAERRRAAAERERQAALVRTERRRIADELGAVVLADLRRVAALATAVRPAADPEPVLAELRQVARRALAAMRRALAVLREAEPEPPPTAARRWSPRPPSRSGAALALLVGLAMVLASAAGLAPPLDRPALVVLFAVQVAALAWWRTAPGPALLVAAAADVVGRLAGDSNLVAGLGPLVLAYRVGAAVPPRVSGPLVAAVAAATTGAHLLGGDPGPALPLPLDAVLTAAGPLAAWGIGALVRLARERRAADVDRLTRANLADERLRIARDLHDLVAHHVSAVAVQAAAARTGPEALAAALGPLEEGARHIETAAAELADLAPTDRPPVLGRAEVDALVAPVRAAGLPVTVQVEGEPAGDATEADLFAHRIVVEALTNVLRHAGPSPTTLVVRHGPTRLEVEVRDSGTVPGHAAATAGSGLGLVGMRERTALVGGTLEAGPEPDGWRVRARLPRPGDPDR